MTANQIQLYYKTSTDPISKHRNLSLGAHTGPPEVSGEGLTVPERVGPRGADNAASLVLACLPCAQAVNPYGRHPLTKKKTSTPARIAVFSLFERGKVQCNSFNPDPRAAPPNAVRSPVKSPRPSPEARLCPKCQD